ncbi:hypothetical protein M9Y10_007647 [Tritrichomonas musculus]|uniref:Uncharacterized protein n=1 Tax=Tritrichomonas musculus TaxID=1915356 RepID=A0ABR2J2W8_9EUKA
MFFLLYCFGLSANPSEINPNEYLKHGITTKSEEKVGFITQFSNLHWSTENENDPPITLYITAKDVTSKKTISAQSYSYTNSAEFNEDKFGQFDLTSLKSSKIELLFQYEDLSKHAFSNEITFNVQKNETASIEIAMDGFPALTLTLTVYEGTYFNRYDTFSSFNDNIYLTDIPFDDTVYFLMTRHEKVTGPHVFNYFSDEAHIGDSNIGLYARKATYVLSIKNINYYSNTDNFNSSRFDFRTFLNISNQLIEVGSRQFYLEKKEYTPEELNLTYYNQKFTIQLETTPDVILEFTQHRPDDQIIRIRHTLGYDRLLEVTGQTDVCVNNSEYGYSITVHFDYLDSATFVIMPVDLEEGNNVSFLTRVSYADIGKEGEIEFKFKKGEKYVYLNLINEDEKLIGNYLYIILTAVHPLLFLSGEKQILPSDSPGEISVINWTDDTMGIVMERKTDSKEEQTIKTKFIISDDKEKALDFFKQDQKEENKEKWKKYLKIAIIVLIICIIISIIISIYCCCRKHNKQSKSDNGLLSL